MCGSSGVVACVALAVELAMQWHGHAHPTAADFPPAFLAIAIVTALAFFVCLRLPADAGSEIANRAPVARPEAVEREEEPRRKAG